MDIEAARENMIKQQIRCCGVLDEDVLQTIRQVPREKFVGEKYLNLAFSDTCLPVGHGQTTWTPLEEARILQALDIYPDDRILEIGTLNGYLTALMAQMGNHVYTVDCYTDLARSAKQRLNDMNITNVTFETGYASGGWSYYAPYDVVLINGSVPEVPEGVHEDMSEFGRVFAVVGDPPVMEAMLAQRWYLDDWKRWKLFETLRPRLPGAQSSSGFVF